MPVDPFRLDAAAAPWPARLAFAATSPLVSWLLQLPRYRQLYAYAQTLPAANFAERALETLDIQTLVSSADLEHIPESGPAIVAANHPHGIVDGLLLASSIARVRPDVRLLANRFLARVPELGPLCFFVDPFGGAAAAGRSHAGLRAAHKWLANGGVLLTFPSGEVAHRRWRPAAHASGSDGELRTADRYRESPWTSTAGRLAIATNAAVVPAFIDGTNSRLFYAAGRLHPSLRTALLPRECLNKRHRSFTVRVGPALAASYECADDLTAALVQAVESLASASATRASAQAFTRHDSVAVEIARLAPGGCLIDSGAFQVFCVEARQIPATLREIGRLRELTYRAIGEGTGQALDLDAFDERYLHLFLWDCERRRVAGAYRIGQTDHLVGDRGVDALYTRTLFVYDERLIARLSPALELGRSFVAPEYQRQSNALALLWKGIGRFLVRYPKYRVLFGPVSISTRYSDRSHQLLMSFLSENHRHEELAALVAAINPKRMTPPPLALPQSIDEVHQLVAQSETDGKGVPVLLRQYLRLNARLLGFNVDPEFGDALDALMMVDLTQVDPAILTRYLGRDGARQFLAHHASLPADAA